MNGFSLMADSIRKVNGNERQASLYDFLGECSQEDLYALFDSTAFNEIAKQYMRATVKRLIASGTIEEEQGTAIRNEYARLFEDMTAKEIMEQ